MNVIIILDKGIASTPVLIKSDEMAEQVFRDIASKLIGEDSDEILGINSDNTYDRVNNYLSHFGKEILFFTDINPI